MTRDMPEWPSPELPAIPDEAEVVSFDVFDTVIVRTVIPPAAVFLLRERELSVSRRSQGHPMAFARARERAEALALRNGGGLDSRVGLGDIYRELGRLLRMEPSDLPNLVTEEQALERSLVTTTQWARALVSAARRTGAQIVFTSDTYLEESFVVDALRDLGLLEPTDRCYVSSAHGKSKASGRLFEHLLDELGAPPGKVIHFGDRSKGDEQAPRRLGINAKRVLSAAPNRYEQSLGGFAWETGGLAASLAGASRLARLNVPADDSHSSTLRDVAAGVAGPFLTAFVLWVLQRAQDHGLDRLYFAARDGQMLHGIAQVLAPRVGCDIDLRYLYVSRRVANLAAVTDTSPAQTAWMFRHAKGATLQTVLSRMDLAYEDVAAELQQKAPLISQTRRLSDDAVSQLRQLVESGSMSRLVLDRALKRRALVGRYLTGEGFFDPVGVGIVDLGGVGSLLRALHSLRMSECSRGTRLLVVGLEPPGESDAASGSDDEWLSDVDFFLYDLRRRQGSARFPGLTALVQTFCSADHGTLVGLVERAGRVEPVLAEGQGEAFTEWGLSTVHRTLEEFATRVELDNDVDVVADVREAVTANIQMLWLDPSAREAIAWGAIPFEDGSVETTRTTSLATPYRWRELPRVLRRDPPRRGWADWPAASAVLSGRGIRTVLRSADIARRLLRRSGVGSSRRRPNRGKQS